MSTAPAPTERKIPLYIVRGTSSLFPWLRRTIAFVFGALFALAVAATTLTHNHGPLLIGMAWVAALAAFLVATMLVLTGISVSAVISPGRLRTAIGATIRASNVTAMSTARVGEKIGIALGLRGERRAMLLEVDTEQDAEAIVAALGAGETGAGESIALDPVAHGTYTLGQSLMHFCAFLAGSLSVPAILFNRAAGIWVAMGIHLALAVVCGRFMRGKPRLVLRRNDLHVEGRLIPYADISNVEHRGVELLLAVGNAIQTVLIGARGHVQQHVLHHILDNSRRARGPAVIKDEVPALLVAKADPAKWLAELDSARVGEDGDYRTHALASEELLRVLHDADRSMTMRAAAARMLVRAGTHVEEVAAALETFHGKHATERARVVAGLDRAADRTAAERALEELEAEESAEDFYRVL